MFSRQERLQVIQKAIEKAKHSDAVKCSSSQSRGVEGGGGGTSEALLASPFLLEDRGTLGLGTKGIPEGSEGVCLPQQEAPARST